MAKFAVFALLALAVAVSAGSLRLHAAAPTQNIVQLAVATPDLSTLVTALTKANLVGALEGPGPFTVFAPTNEAFAKIPSTLLNCLLANPAQLSDILLYHVVSGHIDSKDLQPFQEVATLDKIKIAIHKNQGGVYVNNAKVTTADVEATNGVVHIIDTVLVPEQWEPCAAPSQNIVQIAQATPTLSTLVKAVVAAGLASALSGPGPLTVFAPTDEAFGRVPATVLNCLLNNVTQLQDVLTYHVAKGAVTSAELSPKEVIPTLEGGNVTVNIGQNRVYINNAVVLIPNVFASNGVVHVIDAVLVPTDIKLPCLGL